MMTTTHLDAPARGVRESLSQKITPFKPRTLNKMEKENITRPFLRWVGGKQRLVPSLLDRLPKSFKGQYFEPFLGGGSLFLAKGFKRAELSDLNPQLVNAYKFVRDWPEEIHCKLAKHVSALQSKEADYYYEIRSEFNQNKADFDLAQAARFIFLIHSNFNGMHRVNKKGLYNVPYGHRKNPSIPSLDHLKEVSQLLKSSGVKIECRGYDSILGLVKKGDLVYLDPPYPRLSPTANFTEYTIERFSENEQHKLSEFAKALKDRGALILISNADVPIIRQYYLGWELHQTKLKRNVSSKKPVMSATELIITSYQS